MKKIEKYYKILHENEKNRSNEENSKIEFLWLYA